MKIERQTERADRRGGRGASVALVAVLTIFVVACSGPQSSVPTPLIQPTATTTATAAVGTATATPVRVSPTRAGATPGGTPIGAATPTGAAEGGGVWSSAGALAEGRAGHTATLLADGRLLVVGGERGPSGGESSLSSGEVYDPGRNSWSLTPTLNIGRTAHTATPLPDGRVLVVGGDATRPGQSRASTDSAELFNPQTNVWDLGPNMSIARERHTATPLPDGRVLVTGGEVMTPGASQGRTVTSAEVYDPRTNSWTPVGNLSVPRAGHTATPLPDGRVVVAGGVTDGQEGRREVVSSVEVFDPRNGQWSSVGDLTTGRTDHTATLLPDGRVMVVGGETTETRGVRAQLVAAGSLAIPSATTEILDPQTGRWSPVASLGSPRSGHTTTLLPTGQLLVVGGYGQGTGQPLAVAERYEIATGTWSALPLAGARASHTATLLADGSLILVGGRGTGGSYLAPADRLPSRGVPPSPSPSVVVPSTAPTATATAAPQQPSAPPTATATTVRPPASAAPSPSQSPSARPSPSAAPSASPVPSVAPSPPPPSTAPSAAPSVAPSAPPSIPPSTAPSAAPSVAPSAPPSTAPSAAPSAAPSVAPSTAPSPRPSVAPSAAPSAAPSTRPSTAPSAAPSAAPARPGTVYGIVQGCYNNVCTPLTGVVVSAAGSSTRTSEGSYAIANVTSGTVTVTVSGTVNGSKTVTVPPGGRVDASFTLECKEACR